MYREKLNIDRTFNNLYRYRAWLPTDTIFPELSSLSGCYKSEALCDHLGLKNIWVLFSGYWPARGAFLESLSFKEYEAIGVLSRMSGKEKKVLVISSAGNTALSMIQVCMKSGVPAIVIAPQNACEQFFSTIPGNHRPVLLIALKDAYYCDCIDFVSKICDVIPAVVREGGGYNIARRDFLGVPILHGFDTMGEIPDHYFQAVGSGTGAIAALEANRRLIKDGRFGDKTMKLNLAQNKPFTPIADAWEHGGRDYKFLSNAAYREPLGQIIAAVLSNTAPPWSANGGVYDAMSASKGATYRVGNSEILDAKAFFESLEGVDIQHPSAVAVAALKQAVSRGQVNTDESVLLHITGGGEKVLRKNTPLYPYAPTTVLGKDEIQPAISLVTGFLEKVLRGE